MVANGDPQGLAEGQILFNIFIKGLKRKGVNVLMINAKSHVKSQVELEPTKEIKRKTETFFRHINKK